jgi:hypothetical protein
VIKIIFFITKHVVNNHEINTNRVLIRHHNDKYIRKLCDYCQLFKNEKNVSPNEKNVSPNEKNVSPNEKNVTFSRQFSFSNLLCYIKSNNIYKTKTFS